ncbi:MAG TPA: LysM peptidoglycan-binding domain-containing protein [Acidimicrobiales bacterium]|nr:LysM peptidoglycan-binding domain-containing protein [Acidimicrobiales bacterium]
MTPAAVWTVRPGDSLWSIAEAIVGSPPSRVAAYWLELIRVNRARLPDPADPGLLFPGDEVTLPSRSATG